MNPSRLRIIVGGLLGRCPIGGFAWDNLQYVIGLQQLGHDVYYHEDTWCYPYDPVRKTQSPDGAYSARFIGDFFGRYAPELADCWHYLHLREKSYGMSREAFREVARSADLFLNVSGACAFPGELPGRCIKIFLDTDPGYNQIMLVEKHAWSENVQRWCDEVAAHDRHFTYGENLHMQDCLVPDAGYRWRATRMPVVTDLWADVAAASPDRSGPWTTVMTWNDFQGRLCYRGVEYKSKGAEFEKLLDLPEHVPVPLLVAVGGKDAPRDRLRASKWQVAEGPEVTLTPQDYQDFIRRSRGEISTAKQVYVATRCGWFSTRSACYLAAGRPAVLQETGFSKFIPTGEGLLAFDTAAEAARLVKEVETDYQRHRRAAREIASSFFGAGKVLTKLIDDAFAAGDDS